jgi:hypothetical protein
VGANVVLLVLIHFVIGSNLAQRMNVFENFMIINQSLHLLDICGVATDHFPMQTDAIKALILSR